MKVKTYTKATHELLLSGLGDNIERYFNSAGAWERTSDNLNVWQNGSYNLNIIDKEVHGNLQFKLETQNGSKDDFENSKIIFNAFSDQGNDFSPKDASDPRLWVRLTHEFFHDYTVKRWSSSYTKVNDTKTAAWIQDRFFFPGKGQRARLHNSLARLWWIPYLTVNLEAGNEDDKWKLTEAAFDNTDIYTSLLERTIGTYRNIRYAFLQFYIDNKKLMSGKNIQKALKALNNYGGVLQLSMLSTEDVKDILGEIVENFTKDPKA